MQIIEGLTDAEIAEAHRSKDVFDEVRDMTAPLDALLATIHAFDWLDLSHRDDKAALQEFLTGQYGDPVQLAIGEAKPSKKQEGTKKVDPSNLMKGQKPAQKIFDRFTEIFSKARELVDEEHFLNWQVSFPGVWSDWESAELTGGFDAVIGKFEARRREIAMAQRAADRERMIRALEVAEDPLANARADAAARMGRASGDYPLLSGGDLNIYSLFVERAMTIIKPEGIVGLLTQSE